MECLDINSTEERKIINLLEMGFKNIVLLGQYSYRESKNELEMHRHTNMLEICFMETGSQYYKIGSELLLLRGGDILITPPNIYHGTFGYPEEKGKLYWMIIKIPESDLRLLNLTSLESETIINRLLGLKIKHFKGSPNIKKTLSSIFSIHKRNSNVLNKIEISNRILRFLLDVIYQGEKKSDRSISSDIEFCCRYIEKRIFHKIFIAELADKVNLSESRFKHKFKEEIGIPPNEYILTQKLNKGKELLGNSEISITNLAYDLGFSTSPYFSSVFKKYVGVSPSEYRNTGKSNI